MGLHGMRVGWLLAVGATVTPLPGASARAAVLAFDDASHPAYNAGWTSGTNGGSGFGPWTLVPTQNSNTGGFFVGSSANNGDGGGQAAPATDIDVAGESWGVYSNTGSISEARRPFTGALSVGQRLRFGFDNGWIDDGGTIMFMLTGAEDRLSFRFEGGRQNYQLDDNSGPIDTGVPFTDEGMLVDFLLTGADTYTLTVTPAGSAPKVFSGTLMGTAGTGIEQIEFLNGNAGSFGQRDFFINSLAIVPEPGAIAVAAVAAGLLVRRRRQV